MILRIASDLHLEGFTGKSIAELMELFLPEGERDAEATLVLAGDISSVPTQLISFIDACLSRFPRVFFVPGNHELYRHNINAWERDMAAQFEQLAAQHARTANSAFHFSTGPVENIDIEGTLFIYGTMWGDGGRTLEDQARTGFYLNDFRLIKTEDPARLFTVSDMKKRFSSAKLEIEGNLLEPFNGTKVVITHHLPSRRLVSARFIPSDGSDGANGGFVGDCDDILAYDHAPHLWIHGHTHDTIDTRLWNTRIVCNPAGYRGEWVSKFNTFMKPVDLRQVAQPVYVDLSELKRG